MGAWNAPIFIPIFILFKNNFQAKFQILLKIRRASNSGNHNPIYRAWQELDFALSVFALRNECIVSAFQVLSECIVSAC